MVLRPYEIALHPSLVNLAPFVDLIGMAGDEEVGVEFEDLLLGGE
jgi:hypothetical protein